MEIYIWVVMILNAMGAIGQFCWASEGGKKKTIGECCADGVCCMAVAGIGGILLYTR